MVIPPDVVRWTRDVACQVTAECPGWSIVYQARTGLWIAQKKGGPWILDASSDPTELFVASADVVNLYKRLNLKALSELAAEFGDWCVAYDQGTTIWSAAPPAIPGKAAGLTFSEPSPIKLLHQIRTYLASIGEGDTEPWLSLWGDLDGRE
jgi:hypothetical protein